MGARASVSDFSSRARERVQRQLPALPVQFTLVVGCAESGKSTLVARLLNKPPAPRAWTHFDDLQVLVRTAVAIVPPRAKVEFEDPLLSMQKRAPELWAPLPLLQRYLERPADFSDEDLPRLWRNDNVAFVWHRRNMRGEVQLPGQLAYFIENFQ